MPDSSRKKPNDDLPADVARPDSLWGMARRLLSPAHLVSLARRAFLCVKNEGFEQLWRDLDFRVNLALHRDKWQHRADLPTRRQLKRQRRAPLGENAPRISVIVPLYNTPLPFLKQMLASVFGQSYPNWQLVLINASTPDHPEVEKALRRARRDSRVVCQKVENGGIAANTTAGFALADGDYITLLDHDDLLYRNALYEAAGTILATGAEFVYTDEIVLSGDLKDLVAYHFKPDFSPDTLRGCNYITHLSVFSRALLDRAGAEERGEFEGAQDFDLILRLTEKTTPDKIIHIPKSMYIWRSHAGSTAGSIEAKPYAVAAGERAIDAHLARVGLAGHAESIPGCPGAYRVRYDLAGAGVLDAAGAAEAGAAKEAAGAGVLNAAASGAEACRPAEEAAAAADAAPLVSVIIPNKDHIEDLSRCLESLYAHAGRTPFEVLVVENNSADAATFAYYREAEQKYPALRVLEYAGSFNFSAVNNIGRAAARGSHLLLLNNDIELLTNGFLDEMLMFSQRADVGCVGAKLFYPDDKVQHAGVFLGINGTAGHSHKSHPRSSAGDMYRLATAQNMTAVTGACLMVKTALYDAVGGLDEEKFAVAYNDIDLCLKLWQRGLWNVFTPFAQAYHYESKSRGLDETGPNAERYAREKQNFIDKYGLLIAKGDPFYNPHFNLLFENYGLK